MALKCFDGEKHVWYPSHEWTGGSCSRCGMKQPGVSDADRQEMADQRSDWKDYEAFVQANGPWPSMDEARRTYDQRKARP
jgi:hypothetical protein